MWSSMIRRWHSNLSQRKMILKGSHVRCKWIRWTFINNALLLRSIYLGNWAPASNWWNLNTEIWSKVCRKTRRNKHFNIRRRYRLTRNGNGRYCIHVWKTDIFEFLASKQSVALFTCWIVKHVMDWCKKTYQEHLSSALMAIEKLGNIATLVPNLGLDQTSYKTGLEQLHQDAFTNAIAENKQNIFLENATYPQHEAATAEGQHWPRSVVVPNK